LHKDPRGGVHVWSIPKIGLIDKKNGSYENRCRVRPRGVTTT
jgi:hypothetical protein